MESDARSLSLETWTMAPCATTLSKEVKGDIKWDKVLFDAVNSCLNLDYAMRQDKPLIFNELT